MIRLLLFLLFSSVTAAAQDALIASILLRSAPLYPAHPVAQTRASSNTAVPLAARISERMHLAPARPYWYWEVDDSIRTPFPTYHYIPGQMVGDDDISPVSIRWNFAGKHPLLPAVEIGGFELKAGDGVGVYQKFDGRFGQGNSKGSVWARARHALVAALRY